MHKYAQAEKGPPPNHQLPCIGLGGVWVRLSETHASIQFTNNKPITRQQSLSKGRLRVSKSENRRLYHQPPVAGRQQPAAGAQKRTSPTRASFPTHQSPCTAMGGAGFVCQKRMHPSNSLTTNQLQTRKSLLRILPVSANLKISASTAGRRWLSAYRCPGHSPRRSRSACRCPGPWPPAPTPAGRRPAQGPPPAIAMMAIIHDRRNP